MKTQRVPAKPDSIDRVSIERDARFLRATALGLLGRSNSLLQALGAKPTISDAATRLASIAALFPSCCHPSCGRNATHVLLDGPMDRAYASNSFVESPTHCVDHVRESLEIRDSFLGKPLWTEARPARIAADMMRLAGIDVPTETIYPAAPRKRKRVAK